MSWKENITEIHPNLNEEEKEIFYRNLSEFCIQMYYKYIDKVV